MATRPRGWIADEPVVYAYPDGRRVRGRIAIGRPYRADTRESRCRISLDGWDSAPRGRRYEIAGDSPLQALLLAAQFIGFRLHAFTSSGGRVLDVNGRSELPIEAFFGPLLCDPTPPPSPPARNARRPKTKRAPRPKPGRAART